MKAAARQASRNDPCHCGSGKKYKRCCEAKASQFTTGQIMLLALAAVVLVGGLVLAIASRNHEGQPTGVWSAEHGHYH
jgi:hypothetical protein